MKIDRRLNIVCPIQTDDGTIYIHAIPLSREVFEEHFLVISKTFAAIYGQGLNYIAGPRVAAMMLKKVAMELGVWDGANGVENSLLAEIKRLTNVLLPTPGGAGWSLVTLYDAVRQDMLSAEDLAEVENTITFFICASAMHKRTDLASVLGGIERLWDAQTTLLNVTEFRSSLLTSTATDNLTRSTAAVSVGTAASSVPT